MGMYGLNSRAPGWSLCGFLGGPESAASLSEPKRFDYECHGASARYRVDIYEHPTCACYAEVILRKIVASDRAPS